TEVYTYERVPGSRADTAYLSPTADFSRYSRIYAQPLEIYYEDGEAAPSDIELQQLRAIFRNAFLTAIAEDYEIVYEPAADALGVRASLIKLDSQAYIDELPLQGRLRNLVAVGELTFLMELTDSLSGEVLARAGDRQKPEYAEFEGMRNQDLMEAETAAQYWASLFRDFLDRNLGR
ncbi:MAG: DUF3313 family protein, partial [Gammaproteobacteria bacterium]